MPSQGSRYLGIYHSDGTMRGEHLRVEILINTPRRSGTEATNHRSTLRRCHWPTSNIVTKDNQEDELPGVSRMGSYSTILR